MIAGTTILVVIGCSFPVFNRKIDAELFLAIYPSLRQIYFQDPYLDGKFLYSQFGFSRIGDTFLGQTIDREIKISWQKNVLQYYVPFEL